MPNPNRKDWVLADLVDLEYFLALDEGLDERVLARRDRELYRERLAGAAPASRRELVRHWLGLRRQAARAESSAPLPGEVAETIRRLLTLLLFAAGAAAGGALSLAVLSYSGDQPINLFAAFGLLVAIPFFLALLSAALPALRLTRRGSPSGLIGGWLLGTLFRRLGRAAFDLLDRRNRGRNQRALAQAWGIVRGRGGLYAGLMGWQVFAVMQVAALGFSLAVLLSVLVRGWIADLAFSWQTTTRLSAEQLHGVVVALARPWSALAAPPFSHPTLDQVAGSRVFLKEGLQQLASADLQSWWYFLLWAIAVYALLPRLLLLGCALAWGRRARRRLSFRDARCEALIRRMQRPQIDIAKDDETSGDQLATPMVPPDALRHGLEQLHALVPRELLTDPAGEEWKREIQREFDASLQVLSPVRLDADEDAPLLESLAGASSPARVLLVLEGWQPCITATLEYIKALRRRLGPERMLVVALVGREGGALWRAPAPAQDFDVWRRRLAALGDPMLLVHNWGSASHE